MYSETPVPIPVWVDDYLDTADGVKNRMLIHVLDGNILRANKMIGLNPGVVKLFHATIHKKLEIVDANGESF